MASSAWPEPATPISGGEQRTVRDGGNLRLIDWIWTARGEVPLPDGLSADEALDRIEPIFAEAPRTSYVREAGTLHYAKKDPAAQDTLSAFEKGTLSVDVGAAGPVVRYRLTSRILLFCFLLPLLFIGFGQITLAAGEYQKAKAEAKAKAEPEKAKKDEKKVLELHPIDKMLGAPAPEKPKDGEGGSRKRKPSATAAYVFAGFFVILYLVGRFLEPWLVRRLLRRKLSGA